jgi:hypothetical protein
VAGRSTQSLDLIRITVPVQVHYLRARLDGVRTHPVAGHFYVLTDDGVDAGAVAHDICRERSWQFAKYLVLPQPIDRSSIGANEPEHLHALEAAEKSGQCVVISELGPGENE